jgi:bifunctional DNA primase/polymerase-like protein
MTAPVAPLPTTYAKRGWPVFPLYWPVSDGRCSCGAERCSSPAKHPLTRKGLKDATCDVETIQRWWEHYPQANVAIKTGEDSGLVVIDVDPAHGGEESLAKLEAKHGPLPDTLTSITGGGGRHLFFAHPGEKVPNNAGTKLGKGLDIRGDGGYVCGPPSMHASGNAYQFVNWGTAPAHLPKWLLELLLSRRPTAFSDEISTENSLDLSTLIEGVAHGGRDEAFFRYASSLRGRAVCKEDAILAMESAWRRCEQPPGEYISLEVALEKVDRVYDTYPTNAEKEEEEREERKGHGGRKSNAVRLVEIARDLYEFGLSDKNETYAVRKQGPPLVSMLRGTRQALRTQLANEFYMLTGKSASQQALTDAIGIIEGACQQTGNRQTLYVRVARQGDTSWLDLGDETGTAVKINRSGWSIEPSPPVLFNRTVLVKDLPVPVSGGSLDELWQWLNVEPDDRPLLAAWLIAALYEDIPHPILGLFGEQGTGKTTAMRLIVSAIDATSVPTRKPPRNSEMWVDAAGGSWIVGLDNLSEISPWLSDSLCRAVTGEGDVRRQFYSNTDLVVFEFRRCIILNGIDLGGLRGDLSERLLPIHLRRITEEERLSEADLKAAWKEAHPRILGAILDLAVQIAQVMPTLELARKPRMADFARILTAVDAVLGTRGYARYLDKQSGLAADTLTGDDFIIAIEQMLAKRPDRTFEGTSAELLNLLNPEEDEFNERPKERPRSWPSDGRKVTAHLRRQAPLLRSAGWTVGDDGGANKRGVTRWTITSQTRETANPSPPSPLSLPQHPDQAKRGAEAAGMHSGPPRLVGNPSPPIPAVVEVSPPIPAAKSPAQELCGGEAGMAGMDYGPSLLDRHTAATCFVGAMGATASGEETGEEESALWLARDVFPGAVEVGKGDVFPGVVEVGKGDAA